MREAHFPHNILNLCAAKPREHPTREAKTLRIRHAQRYYSILFHFYCSRETGKDLPWLPPLCASFNASLPVPLPTPSTSEKDTPASSASTRGSSTAMSAFCSWSYDAAPIPGVISI